MQESSTSESAEINKDTREIELVVNSCLERRVKRGRIERQSEESSEQQRSEAADSEELLAKWQSKERPADNVKD